MLLLVGLGNPGERYKANRHNVGFMAVDRVAEKHGFSAARTRFQGELREGMLDGIKTLILKPMTYMNDSGQSVGEALRYFKLEPSQLVVIYDEIDLAPGKLRMKSGGGAAGHNGLRSIDAHIGQDYRRLRIGVGHPGDKDRVSGYVLSDFAKADQVWLMPMLDAIAAEAAWLAKSKDARFTTAVALRLKPPENKQKPTEADQ